MGQQLINRFQHPGMNPAPAQMPFVEMGNDVGAIGTWRLAQEPGERHHDAIGAIATLSRLKTDEHPLHLSKDRMPVDGLDGCYSLACHRPDRRIARLDGLAVDQHRASPAIALGAANPAPFQIHPVTQHTEQWRLAVDRQIHLGAIDNEILALNANA